MSDKAAFVNSVSLTQTSNVNLISPAFKRLLLAQSEFAVLICSYRCISVRLIYEANIFSLL